MGKDLKGILGLLLLWPFLLGNWISGVGVGAILQALYWAVIVSLIVLR